MADGVSCVNRFGQVLRRWAPGRRWCDTNLEKSDRAVVQAVAWICEWTGRGDNSLLKEE